MHPQEGAFEPNITCHYNHPLILINQYQQPNHKIFNCYFLNEVLINIITAHLLAVYDQWLGKTGAWVSKGNAFKSSKVPLYLKNGFCSECVILWLVSGIHKINNAEARVEAFSLPHIDIKLEKKPSPHPFLNQSLPFSTQKKLKKKKKISYFFFYAIKL